MEGKEWDVMRWIEWRKQVVKRTLEGQMLEIREKRKMCVGERAGETRFEKGARKG